MLLLFLSLAINSSIILYEKRKTFGYFKVNFNNLKAKYLLKLKNKNILIHLFSLTK